MMEDVALPGLPFVQDSMKRTAKIVALALVVGWIADGDPTRAQTLRPIGSLSRSAAPTTVAPSMSMSPANRTAPSANVVPAGYTAPVQRAMFMQQDGFGLPGFDSTTPGGTPGAGGPVAPGIDPPPLMPPPSSSAPLTPAPQSGAQGFASPGPGSPTLPPPGMTTTPSLTPPPSVPQRSLPSPPATTSVPGMPSTPPPASTITGGDYAPMATPSLAGSGYATMDNCPNISPPSSYTAASGYGCGVVPASATTTTPYMPPPAQIASPAVMPPASTVVVQPVPVAPTTAAPADALINLGNQTVPVQVGQGLWGQPKAYVPGQSVRNWIRYFAP
ncbi:hypothetical protein [Crateriforma conspicua]|uniref:Uncharacterized protein n=1 Tax=Crateriforma conspicua TaxID=2527996 RepID=A0A5C5YA27_9PLAN|nr:hypothetical protein [Crateriforma conspicua]TWT71311.1 hypothetical protein Pan14r_36210 [Crateriforma conspicua]